MGLSPTGILPSVSRRSSRRRLGLPLSRAGFTPPHNRSRYPASTTREGFSMDTVWTFPLSLATTRGISFPRGTKMFQFPRCPSAGYGFTRGWRGIARAGLPHSEIPGSTPACGFPGLFAARCVLRRHLVPRHPPCALCSLTFLRLALLEDAFTLCGFQGACSCLSRCCGRPGRPSLKKRTKQ